jgi:cation transport regulator ChaC
MGSDQQYVFGYGSLLTPAGDGIAGMVAGQLRGYRRTWNVAMDNSRAIPGYKQYVDPTTGTPPRCFVVFLNIVTDPDRDVNGALFPVSANDLAALDRRERNYDRIEVSSSLAEPVAGPVWTYVGSKGGMERFQTGVHTDSAVISAGYAQAVRRGLALLGNGAEAEFDSMTDPPPCPIVPLRRVPVPGR